MSLGRIAVLPPALADQIAAGEVVERPASIVKELLDNAVDAGATRVEIELAQGGRELIRVVDDGRGIHPEDLLLALTRHATSKLHTPDQLVEIHTLGFRGEALASVAAVAGVEIRTRTPDAKVGRRARSQPGQPPTLEPIGMPLGTQVEITRLFANVPARRKFLRAEATEVGHCIEAVVRVALVHPQVHIVVRQGPRELLSLPAGDQSNRIAQVLDRSGAPGPLFEVHGERAGVSVRAWFAPPEQAQRQRGATFVVVRRRVIQERTLAHLLRQAYGDNLTSEVQPPAVLIVEPPPGGVDVNVHPQKSEVRFADPQHVLAIVRELLAEGLAEAPWFRVVREPGDVGEHDWTRRDASLAAMSSWSGRAGPELSAERRVGYRLETRALGSDYAADKQDMVGAVDRLRATLRTAETDGRDNLAPTGTPTSAAGIPELIGHLPGPVALFEDQGSLLAIDLRRLRAHLIRRRMIEELSAAAGRRVPAQGLLEPVVVRRRSDECELLVRHQDTLLEVGVDLDAFGAGAVVVRAVPAILDKLVDASAVGRLLDRLVPWLRMQDHADSPTPWASKFGTELLVDAVADVAETSGPDPTPRLARAWLAEAMREGPIEGIPGVRRWTAADLLE